MRTIIAALVLVASCAGKTPEPTQTPPDSEPTFDAFARAVLEALADKSPDKLNALALASSDVRPLLELGLEKCADRMPPGANLDSATAEMQEMLGSDTQRAEEYANYHADCAAVSDFAGASLVSAEAKDAVYECGGGSADRLVIEARVRDAAVFVVVDDPILTKDGWKMPESVRCALSRP